MNSVIIFTDGACLNNGRGNARGGWAAMLTWRGKQKVLCGPVPKGEQEPTNNRAELQAVIEALKALMMPCKVTIMADSTYVGNRIEQLETLHNNQWEDVHGKAVKNSDLLMELLAAKVAGKHELAFQHIKGHSGCPENEIVDKLARAEAMKVKVQVVS